MHQHNGKRKVSAFSYFVRRGGCGFVVFLCGLGLFCCLFGWFGVCLVEDFWFCWGGCFGVVFVFLVLFVFNIETSPKSCTQPLTLTLKRTALRFTSALWRNKTHHVRLRRGLTNKK